MDCLDECLFYTFAGTRFLLLSKGSTHCNDAVSLCRLWSSPFKKRFTYNNWLFILICIFPIYTHLCILKLNFYTLRLCCIKGLCLSNHRNLESSNCEILLFASLSFWCHLLGHNAMGANTGQHLAKANSVNRTPLSSVILWCLPKTH